MDMEKSGTKGNERQIGEPTMTTLSKGEYEKADLEMKVIRKEREVHLLNESLEWKNKILGETQQELRVMTENHENLERKYNEVGLKFDEIGKRFIQDDRARQFKNAAKVRKLQKRIKALENERDNIIKENKELKFNLAKMMEDEGKLVSKEKMQLAEKYVEETHERMGELQQINTAQRVKIEDLQENIEELNQAAKYLEDEALFLREENKSLEIDCQDLRRMKSRSDEYIKKMTNLNKENDKAMLQQNERYKSLQDENTMVNDGLDEALFKIEKLEFQLTSGHQLNVEYEAEMQKLREECETLRLDLKTSEIRIEEYEKRFEFMNTEMDILQKKIICEGSVLQNRGIKEMVEFCYQGLKNQQVQKISEVTSNIGCKAKQVRLEEREYDRFDANSAKLRSIQREKEALKQKIIQLQQELREVKSLNNIRSEYPRHQYLTYLNEELKRNNERLRNEVESQKMTSRNYEKKNDELQKVIQDMQSHLVDNYEKAERIKLDGDDKTEENDEMKRRIEMTLKENDNLFKTIFELRALNSSLVKKLEVVNCHLEEEKSKHAWDKKDWLKANMTKDWVEEISHEGDKYGGRQFELENGRQLEKHREGYKEDGSKIVVGNSKQTLLGSIEATDNSSRCAQNAVATVESEETPDFGESTSKSRQAIELRDMEVKSSVEVKKPEIVRSKSSTLAHPRVSDLIHLEEKYGVEGEAPESCGSEASRESDIDRIKELIMLKHEPIACNSSFNEPSNKYTQRRRSSAETSPSFNEQNNRQRRRSSADMSPSFNDQGTGQRRRSSADMSAAFFKKRSSRFENVDIETEEEVKERLNRISKKELDIISETSLKSSERGQKSVRGSTDELENAAKTSQREIQSAVDGKSAGDDVSHEFATSEGIGDHVHAGRRFNPRFARRASEQLSYRPPNRVRRFSLNIQPEMGYSFNGVLPQMVRLPALASEYESNDSLADGYLDALEHATDEASAHASNCELMLKDDDSGEADTNQKHSEKAFPNKDKQHLAEEGADVKDHSRGRYSDARSDREKSKLKQRASYSRAGSEVEIEGVDGGRISAFDKQTAGESGNGKSAKPSYNEENRDTSESEEEDANQDSGPSGEPHSRGRRHSLAFEMLRRKKLDFDYKMEFKAQQMSEEAKKNRRFSAGEVDAEKLREKAKIDKERKDKSAILNEDLGFDHNEHTISKVGWFQLTALQERKKRKGKKNEQPKDSDFDIDEDTDIEGKDGKATDTDHSDLSGSDSSDSDDYAGVIDSKHSATLDDGSDEEELVSRDEEKEHLSPMKK